MVSGIRIYFEGGGDSKDTKIQMREGLSTFLKDLVSLARSRRIKWQIIVCGSRNDAYDSFKTALKAHSTAFNILLVDSEGPITQEPWQHLRDRDRWGLRRVNNTHCHLMVQAMEAWLIADVDALEKYYGQRFNKGAIPPNQDVEQISKRELERALKAATQKTKTKGAYHKTRHASELLARLDAKKVCNASKHCKRLFTTLIQKMNG